MNEQSDGKNRIPKERFGEWANQYREKLQSFLYRFTASKEDAEDLTQETFVKALKHLDSFEGRSSFKTWVFAIAANLAKDHIKARKRWTVDAQDKCKKLIGATPEIASEFKKINHTSAYGKYEIREHIDFCFTCIMKTLPLEQHLALMLKDIYAFKVKEIADILGKTHGSVKHYIHNARSTMRSIFEHRCALINKKGTCHQCSELNGLNNSKAETQRKIAGIDLVKAAKNPNNADLFAIRSQLVKNINPLKASGTDLHDFLLKYTRRAQQQDSN